MKFLADENVPLRAVRALRGQGLDVISVAEVRRGMSDEEVMALARREDRIIITFDKDFGELIFKRGEEAPGVVLLRIRPKSPNYIADVLRYLLLISPVGRNLRGRFLVVREDKFGKLFTVSRPMSSTRA